MEEENVLRILVASDVHLGYQEKEPELAKDSFNSFEEVFVIAQERNADFVLLGGDLFHENKPSRKTLHSCMEIMKRYCLGDRPCQVQVLSDQCVNFGHTSPTVSTVNYEDPNINISMPVFTIHGNHDDPAGAGSLSPIDLLSVAGYLNHFGRTSSLENIEISPVLLQKGSTKLALYGLGSIRDERLHRMFLKRNVKFMRPKISSDEWFNIMVIHQNRVKHGPTNYIPEEFLDKFLDLVIWGHEHECVGNLEWNTSQDFFVLQPGSTVATSLSPGESKKKHVVLLEICGRKMKPEYIELRTVRNMYIEDIVLKDAAGIPAPSVPTIEADIQKYCEEKIEILLEKAEGEMSGHPKQPDQPLIRLRIDHSGDYPVFNSYRLSGKFTDRVANHDSMIRFEKKAAARVKSEKQDMKDFDDMIGPAVVENVKIEDFVEEFLRKEDSLSVLSARGMTLAVKEYVEKKEKDAIHDLCLHQVQKTLEYLKTNCPRAMEEVDILAGIDRYREVRRDTEDEKTVEDIVIRGRENRTALGINRPYEDDDDDDTSRISDDEPEVPTKRKSMRGGRGSRGGSRGRGRGRGSRGSKTSKAAIPVAETSSRQSTIMDAMASVSLSSRRSKPQPKSAMITEICDSDDNGVQSMDVTTSKPKRSSSKRARGVQFEEDQEDNPFSFTKKRR